MPVFSRVGCVCGGAAGLKRVVSPERADPHVQCPSGDEGNSDMAMEGSGRETLSTPSVQSSERAQGNAISEDSSEVGGSALPAPLLAAGVAPVQAPSLEDAVGAVCAEACDAGGLDEADFAALVNEVRVGGQLHRESTCCRRGGGWEGQKTGSPIGEASNNQLVCVPDSASQSWGVGNIGSRIRSGPRDIAPPHLRALVASSRMSKSELCEADPASSFFLTRPPVRP